MDIGFEPIGDDTHPFVGTLDGNSHTISNLWIFRKTTPFVGLFGFMSTGSEITTLAIENSRIVGASNTGGVVGYLENGNIAQVTNTNSSVRAYLSYYGGGIAGYMKHGTLNEVNVVDGTVHGSGNIIGGVVGYLENGSVDESSSSADIDGGEYIGGFVGEMIGGSISDSVATGDVISNSTENDYVYIVKTGQYSGGFVGRMEGGVITDSHATGSVTAESSFAGGFAGTIENASDILHDVYATGAVTGSSVVGGFAGIINGIQIQDAYATGTVTSVGDTVGGFVGQSACGSIFTRTYATGNVTGGDRTGGFSGADGCEGPGSTFIQSYATGNVNGAMSVGGFLGQTYDSTVTNAYASGNVEGTMKTGGFAGEVFGGTYINAYSRGHVQAGTSFNAFIGEVPNSDWSPTIVHSLYDEDTAMAGSTNGGTGKTTIEMTSLSTFIAEGWDFDSIWTMNSGNSGYPFFQWQNLTPDPTLDLVLTTVTSVPSQSTIARAVYYFSTSSDIETALQNETGNYLAEYAGCADCEVRIDPINHTVSITGLRVGDIINFQFGFQVGEQVSNLLRFGPVTIIGESSSGSGGGMLSSLVFTPSKITETTKETCPADQLLTQNLKSGARNGKYHPYTKAIVKEVKILQAHMNRLGFNSGAVDGILGKVTDGAIKRMQKYLGTYQDGLVGPVTRGLINNSCGTNGLQKS